MNLIEDMKRITKALLPAGKEIDAIYVFGSSSRGEERPGSDIDMAFIFNEQIYRRDPFRALQKAELLATEISKELHKSIDVAILNGSSLMFSYHVVNRGICIYEVNPADRILYEVILENKYKDFVPFIKDLRDSKRRALIGRD